MKRTLVRLIALLLVPCLIIDPVGAGGLCDVFTPGVSPSQGVHRDILATQALTASFIRTLHPFIPAPTIEEDRAARRAAFADARELSMSPAGGRWPWLQKPLYNRVDRVSVWLALRVGVGTVSARRIGWFMGQVLAPVVVEGGAAFWLLNEWAVVFSGSWISHAAGAFVTLFVWQILHAPKAPGPQRLQRLIHSFVGERALIPLLTVLLAPALIYGLHLPHPLIVFWWVFNSVHLVVTLLGVSAVVSCLRFVWSTLWHPVSILWGTFSERWHWRRVDTAERFQKARYWTYQRALREYGMKRRPEFLLPHSLSWLPDGHEQTEAAGITADVVMELEYHVPVAGLARIVTWLVAKLSFAGWLQVRQMEIIENRVRGKVDALEHLMSRLQKLKWRRWFSKRTHLLYGYVWTDFVIDAFKNPHTDRPEESTSDWRQQHMYMLGGYFEGILKTKKRKILDKRDVKILHFLDTCLDDSHFMVVRRTIRAIVVNVKRMTEGQKAHFLERYRQLLRLHPSELVRAAVVRTFFQELASFENIRVCRRALEVGWPTPQARRAGQQQSDSELHQWVESYLAQALEVLISGNRHDLEEDPPELRKLAAILVRKADNPRLINRLRVNAIRALGQLPTVDPAVLRVDVIGRLTRILREETDPSVQAAALWALPNLCVLAGPDRQEAVFHQLNAFVQGAVVSRRRDPILERDAITVMRGLALHLKNERLLQWAGNQVPSAFSNLPCPGFFLNGELYVGPNPPDHALSLTGTRASALMNALNEAGIAVVMTHGFLQNRDEAMLQGVTDGKTPLMMRYLIPVLNKLSRSFAVLVPSRDPLRGRHADRMERHVIPIPGMPFVVIGRAHEHSWIEKAWKRPLPLLEYFPEINSDTPDYNRLITFLREQRISPVNEDGDGPGSIGRPRRLGWFSRLVVFVALAMGAGLAGLSGKKSPARLSRTSVRLLRKAA